MATEKEKVKYPGILVAMDGNSAVIMCERESSDAAGAYPITPSTQMGEYWAEETAKGHINISGYPLIFIEPDCVNLMALPTRLNKICCKRFSSASTAGRFAEISLMS